MSALLLVMPLLVPLVAALAGTLAPRSVRVQRTIGAAGALGLFVAGLALFAQVFTDGAIAVQIGGWPAPHGITLVADGLAAAMVAVTGLIALAVAVYAIDEIQEDLLRAGFFPFVHILLLGVCGAFVAGDLFNLYVWFEVMLLASFVLLALGGERRALTSSVTYVALNLIASAFFLVGIGWVYGQIGSLNMADLSVRLASGSLLESARPGALLLFVAFAIKAGLFPVFFWLPASYPTTRFAISALFAALLTKVGVYAMIRVFTLVFPLPELGLTAAMLGVAMATMATGVLAAASQSHIRRILSFHIVSQIGYMVLGLALWTTLGLASAIFYLIHHIVTKANLFLVAGWMVHRGGNERLGKIGGLSGAGPVPALLFAVPALSLAGIPPFSGFFAKFYVLRAGFDAEALFAVAVAALVGLLTIYSMAKIWIEAFWKPAPAPAGDGAGMSPATLLACGGLASVTVALGVGAEALWAFAERSARELIDRDAYVQAVLGVLS